MEGLSERSPVLFWVGAALLAAVVSALMFLGFRWVFSTLFLVDLPLSWRSYLGFLAAVGFVQLQVPSTSRVTRRVVRELERRRGLTFIDPRRN